MRVLIISYYFPPCNSIVSNRIYSFFNEMIDRGYSVDVITRHWEGDENTWNSYYQNSEENSVKIEFIKDSCVHYLPYKNKRIIKKHLYSKFKILRQWMNGDFNTEVNTLTFLEYATELIKDKKHNFLLVSSPPINICKLGYLIKERFPGINLIFDFRDLYNDFILSKKNTKPYKRHIELFFFRLYMSKWLKDVNKVYVASGPFRVYLAQKFKVDSEVLLNGFDENRMANIDIKKPSRLLTKDKFHISILGTIYPDQDTSIFINSILSLNAIDKINIQLNLIGLESIPEVANRFQVLNSHISLNITPRIPFEDAISIGCGSQLLVYMGWNGFRGIYSGKIFDYLWLQKPILICPGDNDVIDKLIVETQSGMSANNIEHAAGYIKMKLDEYSSGCGSEELGNHGLIRKYSRQFQNKKLINYIDNTEMHLHRS